jgi:hypothetical protein
MIVFELEFAAMQARNRRSKAEPQARTRLGSALFEPHEAFHHPAAIGIRNARPVIGNAKHNALAFIIGPNHDLRGHAV